MFREISASLEILQCRVKATSEFMLFHNTNNKLENVHKPDPARELCGVIKFN